MTRRVYLILCDDGFDFKKICTGFVDPVALVTSITKINGSGFHGLRSPQRSWFQLVTSTTSSMGPGQDVLVLHHEECPR